MKNLKAILKKFSNSSRLLGTEETPTPTFDKEQLKIALTALSKKSNTFFGVCAITAALVFIVGCFFITQFLNDPAKLQVIFGATGISMSGLLAYMNKIWKEKVSTDMILALVGVLKEENLNAIVVALLAKI